MAERYPNDERITAFEAKMRQNYSVDRLSEWKLSELQTKSDILQNEFDRFRGKFQRGRLVNDSMMEIVDGENYREPLTEAEELRLTALGNEINGNFATAIGRAERREEDRKVERTERYSKAIARPLEAIRGILTALAQLVTQIFK